MGIFGAKIYTPVLFWGKDGVLEWKGYEKRWIGHQRKGMVMDGWRRMNIEGRNLNGMSGRINESTQLASCGNFLNRAP